MMSDNHFRLQLLLYLLLSTRFVLHNKMASSSEIASCIPDKPHQPRGLPLPKPKEAFSPLSLTCGLGFTIMKKTTFYCPLIKIGKAFVVF